MFKRLIATTTLLLAASANAEPSATAQAFANALAVNNNFKNMMQAGAAATQTYRHILCAAGATAGKALVAQEMTAATAKYQPQWNMNTAAAWSQLLSDDEMASLQQLRSQSPFVAKYQGGSEQAGQLMKASSSELLARALSEGMNKAWEKASPGVPHDPAAPCKP